MMKKTQDIVREALWIKILRSILISIYELRYTVLTLASAFVVLLVCYSVYEGRKEQVKSYNLGEITIPALGAEQLSKGKISTVGSVVGDGVPVQSKYEYAADGRGVELLQEYIDNLSENYGAYVKDKLSEKAGEYTSQLYIQGKEEGVKLMLSYNGFRYTVDMILEPLGDSLENAYTMQQAVDMAEAKDILLTLTKAETGFTAEIGVYTIEYMDEPVDIGGFKYHVFNVIAEYSKTRREFRGTFYIAHTDGMVLRYNVDDKTTTLVRKGIF